MRICITFFIKDRCTKQNQNPIPEYKWKSVAKVAQVEISKNGDEEGEDAIFFEEVEMGGFDEEECHEGYG